MSRVRIRLEGGSSVSEVTLSRSLRTPRPFEDPSTPAGNSRWKKFRHELVKLEQEIKHLFSSNENVTFEEKYKRWLKKVERAAWISIGKTTTKPRKIEKFSLEVQTLRNEKRELKKQFKTPQVDQKTTITQ